MFKKLPGDSMLPKLRTTVCMTPKAPSCSRILNPRNTTSPVPHRFLNPCREKEFYMRQFSKLSKSTLLTTSLLKLSLLRFFFLNKTSKMFLTISSHHYGHSSVHLFNKYAFGIYCVLGVYEKNVKE